jgi:hypothetical protein
VSAPVHFLLRSCLVPSTLGGIERQTHALIKKYRDQRIHSTAGGIETHKYALRGKVN